MRPHHPRVHCTRKQMLRWQDSEASSRKQRPPARNRTQGMWKATRQKRQANGQQAHQDDNAAGKCPHRDPDASETRSKDNPSTEDEANIAANGRPKPSNLPSAMQERICKTRGLGVFSFYIYIYAISNGLSQWECIGPPRGYHIECRTNLVKR